MLQRKFTREMAEDCPNNNYYVHFREWIKIKYPHSEISEETWEHLIADDLRISYDDDNIMIDHEEIGEEFEGSHREGREEISINEYVDNVLDANQ